MGELRGKAAPRKGRRAAPATAALAEDHDSSGQKLRQDQGPDEGAQAVHRLRGGPLSQHRRVLGRRRARHPDSHDYGEGTDPPVTPADNRTCSPYLSRIFHTSLFFGA